MADRIKDETHDTLLELLEPDATSRMNIHADQDDSRLMRLPAELRNEIYELVFSGRQGVASFEEGRKPKAPAILVACRQTYSEALPIYYSVTNFGLELEHERDCRTDRRILRNWASRIGPEKLRWISCIGYLRICLPDGYCTSLRRQSIKARAIALDRELKSYHAALAIFSTLNLEALQVKVCIHGSPTYCVWTKDPQRVIEEYLALCQG